MRTLRTVDDVIKWLGGPTRAATWLGCTDQNIFYWRRKKMLPTGYHLLLVVRARREGVAIDPSVFGIVNKEDEEEVRLLFRRDDETLSVTA